MKLFAVLLFILSFSAGAQTPMNEKDAIEKSHIDFSKQYLFFVIHGIIEIDGHQFKNDTCKSPIIYKATLDEISIQDTLNKVEYSHRNCNISGCKIIHLNKKQRAALSLIATDTLRTLPYFFNDPMPYYPPSMFK